MALVIVEIIHAIVTERYNFSAMLLGFAVSVTNLRFETLQNGNHKYLLLAVVVFLTQIIKQHFNSAEKVLKSLASFGISAALTQLLIRKCVTELDL